MNRVRDLAATVVGRGRALGRLTTWRWRARDRWEASYHRQQLPALVVLTVVCAVEVALVDVVVRRWPVARGVLLVLGLVGMLGLLSYLASVVTRPHLVDDRGITVRSGTAPDLPLTWDDIASVELRAGPRTATGPEVADDPGGAVLHLPVAERTNLWVTLDRPLSLPLPDGPETVGAIALYADDPRGFLAEVRRIAGTPMG